MKQDQTNTNFNKQIKPYVITRSEYNQESHTLNPASISV